MRVTSKGQVTIPVDIRRRLGITPNSEVEFVVEEGQVVLRRLPGAPGRGRALVERMRGRATARSRTDEIMDLTRGEE